MNANTSEEELDEEWVKLIKMTLELGIAADEIRNFLNKSS
ncbi:anti-repressor SinI family protein [Neobacillus mesonae]|nr:anti-repressor SinI family protein [Neobacillus mesonae]MCM3570654.1 anti-repressor SinI family protein [Neobacillus mesonae]